MRSGLYHGRFVPPVSLCAAAERHKQVTHECSKIESQLGDPARGARLTEAERAAWRTRAKHALKILRVEDRSLATWIERHSGVDALLVESRELLREAYDILQTLEVEVDFEPEETAIMKKLDEYFAKGENNGHVAIQGNEVPAGLAGQNPADAIDRAGVRKTGS